MNIYDNHMLARKAGELGENAAHEWLRINSAYYLKGLLDGFVVTEEQ